MRTLTTGQFMAIDERVTGMPGIAHGGYVAGLLATALQASSAEVRLKSPIRPGRPVTFERNGDGRAMLRDGDMVLAEAETAILPLEVPRPVTLLDAAAASARYPGHDHHPFPGCFACGLGRRAGDGLRVFPGPVAGRRLVATPWDPPSDRPELVWAAFDCMQLWSLMVHAPAGSADQVVTATLAARFERQLRPDRSHVLIGWPIGRFGRKWRAGAALFGPDGALVAAGYQTAAVVDGWGVPLGRERWSVPDS